MVKSGGLIYIDDSALISRDDDTLCYELFGKVGIGKLVKVCLIKVNDESFEGEGLEDLVVLGRVILTITKYYDEKNNYLN